MRTMALPAGSRPPSRSPSAHGGQPRSEPVGQPRLPRAAEIDGIVLGPSSVAWQFGSDPRLYLSMLYPLLLQVGHPVVAAGVSEHSDFRRQPWQRLVGTLDYVTVLIYGGREAAVAGRRLRAMHNHIRGVRPDGQPYHALQPEAYAWVHATLISSYVQGHQQFGRPMRPEQRDQFLREYRGLGRLIGVRDAELPQDWDGFVGYLRHTMDEQLVPTQALADVLETVQEAGRPPLPVPLPAWVWGALRIPARRALWLGGVGLLPSRIRERLGIPWSSVDEIEFQLLGGVSRGFTPLMPDTLRTPGPLQLRLRRREIAKGPLGVGDGRHDRAALGVPGTVAAGR